ncbi:hypothetical protein D3C73_1403150 [compost metagenome]
MSLDNGRDCLKQGMHPFFGNQPSYKQNHFTPVPAVIVKSRPTQRFACGGPSRHEILRTHPEMIHLHRNRKAWETSQQLLAQKLAVHNNTVKRAELL